MSTKFEKSIKIDTSGITAIEALSQNLELSKQKIKEAMQKGCVWQSSGKHTRRIRRAKKELKQGELLHIYYDEQVLNMEPTPPELIADEKDYSIWNKPCRMLSQGSKWGDHCTVTRWAEQHLKPHRPAFVVHRLDRSARGLIVVAHTKKAAAALSKMFADRKVEKIYHAQVSGRWPHQETITLDSPVDGKTAVSHVTPVRYLPERAATLLEIAIETGRKHQIRKHLANQGFPIVGDRLYGSHDTTSDLQLIAVKLHFQCPLTGVLRHYQLTH
jgi:tRNA pseudouridine32 synthase/23S rRNA pseudouridine746 synthase